MRPLLFCLALLSAPAGAEPPAPPESRPTVRLPAFEVASLNSAEAFAKPSMPLSPGEKLTAESVYGGALDLDVVRLAVAPLDQEVPRSVGNVIRIPVGYDWDGAALVHELAHVWQFQTRGLDYVSNSFLQQACGIVVHGNRSAAYKYKLEEKKSLFEFGAEQQAQIIEDWYKIPFNRADPLFAKMIAQMRSAKAVKNAASLFTDLSLGLSPKGKEPPPLPKAEPSTTWTPALEVRW